MKRLIVHGDPGIRKGAVIDYDGEEMICFSVTRNGDYHGPDRVQLWCVIGTADETADFVERNFVPHFLETESTDAAAIDVLQAKGELPA